MCRRSRAAGSLAEKLISCPNNIHAIILGVVRSKIHRDSAACVVRVWISVSRDVSACRPMHEFDVAYEKEIFLFDRRHMNLPPHANTGNCKGPAAQRPPSNNAAVHNLSELNRIIGDRFFACLIEKQCNLGQHH